MNDEQASASTEPTGADDGVGRDGSVSEYGGAADVEDLADLLDQLDELEDIVDTEEERDAVEAARLRALELSRPRGMFGNVISGFDAADAAEMFLGSVLFGIPMLVEGGTQEVGEFLAVHPLFLIGTVVGTIVLAHGIIYVAGIQDVRVTHRVFGIVPRRMVGVVGIAALTAVAMMTAWGRVDWATPGVAIAQCAVAAVPMTIGGALGDLLPGT